MRGGNPQISAVAVDAAGAVVVVGRGTGLLSFDSPDQGPDYTLLTSSNLTVAGSLGAKDKAAGSLPSYTDGRLGGNQNFFNNSTTMTIGPAEGAAVIIIGRQDGAPPLDLHLVVD